MDDFLKEPTKYNTISLPRDLTDAIDKAIKDGKLLGYLNRSEFCKEAIRVYFYSKMSSDRTMSKELLEEIIISLGSKQK